MANSSVLGFKTKSDPWGIGPDQRSQPSMAHQILANRSLTRVTYTGTRRHATFCFAS